MTPIGARVAEEKHFPMQFYSQRYYEVLDRVFHELELRFTDNRNVILSVASCNPKNDHFFRLDHVQPLAEESGIDLIKLAPQLDIARSLRSKGVESMEDIMKELLPLQHDFTKVYHIIKLVLLSAMMVHR